MTAEPVREEPGGKDPSRRPPIKPTAVAIAVAALLVPLLLLFVLYRGGRTISGPPATPPSGGGASQAAAGADAVQAPSISEKPVAGLPPFANLKEPRDAALDDRGRLWIADFGNSRLRIFDAEGGSLGGWGGRGNERFAFRDPSAVAIRGDDVYVADTWNGRVSRFGLGGEWRGEAGGLFGPRGIGIASDGAVWVSDTGNHRVVAYPADLGPPRTFGQIGTGPGQFSSPVGIAVTSDGTVLVADTGNRRIARLSATGDPLGAWAIDGWERAVEPHIEIDTDGSVWVTDPGAAEVVLHLDPTGKTLEKRTEDDQGRRFSLPTGLALDAKRRVLYVVNSGSHTVSTLRLAAGTRP